MEKDCYEVLGVPRRADAVEIKAAYRALALERHPDRNAGDPRAAERFMLIQSAYEVLGNPVLRARYDLALASRPAPRPKPKAAPPRGLGAWALPLIGALIALKGFAGVIFLRRDEFLPSWLLPGLGREESFLLYMIGAALVIYGAGRPPRID